MTTRSTSIGIGNDRLWLLEALGRLLSAHRKRRAKAEMISTLSGLEDHTLADIGVTRNQIPAIARRLARRYS